MSYYRSAGEMAGDLSLAILMRADPDPRVLRRQDRISGYAADPAHGARIYNLVKAALTRQGASAGLAGRALWVAAPWGSLHHLPWVVGLAEHAARDGLMALLADSGESSPLTMLAEGAGSSIPGFVLPAEIVAGPAQACSTDLEGVSVVRRGPPDDSSQSLLPASRPWCLLRADALPEDLDGPYQDAGGTDGIILVAPFRDHSREELTAIVRGLRKAGHSVLGLVAVGPKAGEVAYPAAFAREPAGPHPAGPVDARAPAPADRADAVAPAPAEPEGNDTPAAADAADDAPPAPADAADDAPPAPADAADDALPAPADAAGLDEGPRAVPLITSWDLRSRKRQNRWPAAVILTALILAATAAYLFRGDLFPISGRPDGPAHLPYELPGVEAGSDLPHSPVPDGHGEPLPRPDRAGDNPARSAPRPIGLEIAGEDELGSSEHDDTHWDLLDDPGPKEASGAGEMEPGFGLALPAGSVGMADPTVRPDEGFVVHLSSFRLQSEADREVRDLIGRGIDARHVRVVIPGKGFRPWYRVVTGQSATFAEAESLALVLISGGKTPNAHVAGLGGHGEPVQVVVPD